MRLSRPPSTKQGPGSSNPEQEPGSTLPASTAILQPQNGRLAGGGGDGDATPPQVPAPRLRRGSSGSSSGGNLRSSGQHRGGLAAGGRPTQTVEHHSGSWSMKLPVYQQEDEHPLEKCAGFLGCCRPPSLSAQLSSSVSSSVRSLKNVNIQTWERSSAGARTAADRVLSPTHDMRLLCRSRRRLFFAVCSTGARRSM